MRSPDRARLRASRTSVLLSAAAACFAVDASAQAIAPQPFRPSSASCVTSATPVLRWNRGNDDAHVRLCRDRECATVIDEFDAHDHRATPRQPLAPGVVFWNVRSGANTSPTWSFVVQAHPSTHDLVMPRCADFDGDGFGDVVLDSGRAGSLLVTGGGHGLARRGRPVPVLPTRRGRASISFDTFLAGDVDGDGFADLVASSPRAHLPSDQEPLSYPAEPGVGRGGVLVVRGGGAHRSPGSPLEIVAPPREEWFGETTESVGDVNGDGRVDLAISSRSAPLYPCLLHVTITSVGSNTPVPLDLSRMGCEIADRAIAGAGDVDGDGFADVLLATQSRNASVRARLFFGSASGIRTSVDLDVSILSPGPDDTIRVAGLGDIDADGYADFALSVEPGRLAIWHGARGSLPAPSLYAPPSNVPGDSIGLEMADLGDLDGDDRSEFAFSVNDTTMAWVRGSATNTATTFSQGYGGATAYFGGWIRAIGDVDDDGFADVIVGTTCARSDDVSGDVCIRREYHEYRGGPGGLDASRHRSVVP